MSENKRWKEIITTSIISIILVNLGLSILKEDIIISLITTITGFALLYFSYYSYQIRENEKRIKELEAWKTNKEELLNTIKDIIILKKVSRLK